MMHVIEAHLPAISEICCACGVERLELFGSAARGTSTDISDVDIVVTFRPEAREKAFDNYFGLRERLEALLGRRVDLLTSNSLRNPYLIREIEAERQLLYAA